MIRGRLHRRGPREHDEGSPDDEYIEIDPAELSGIFTVPLAARHRADVLAAGRRGAMLAVRLAGGADLGDRVPLIVAGVVAAVASPLVAWMQRHHIPRPIGTVLVLLGLVAVGVATSWL